MNRLPTRMVAHKVSTFTKGTMAYVAGHKFPFGIALLLFIYVGINGVSFRKSNATLNELQKEVEVVEEKQGVTSEKFDSIVQSLKEEVEKNNELILNTNGQLESLKNQKVAEVQQPEKVIIDDNAANTFSNVAIVLNPNYFKSHNVDKKVQQDLNSKVAQYVARYAPVAKVEQNLYGIPASISLAQGLLESDAGGSRLARNANNHFGIKCFSNSCKKGHCINATDDSHKDFFRNYKGPWESYRDHSMFLQRDRYKHLLKLKKTDYKGWAHGLRKAGYATDKRYAEKLIKIIETLKLHKYDK